MHTKIMVVDDDPAQLQSLVRVLTRDGFEVSSAQGVDAALSLLIRDGEVPLIVSDIDMPGRNGLDLLSTVRARYPDIAVLMLTGGQDIETAVASLKLGARDYLAKPVEAKELRARIEKALADRAGSLEARKLRERYVADLESEVRILANKTKMMFLAQVEMAVTMLEAKSPYTRGHSARVAEYAAITARGLRLAPELVEQIRLGGQLHDIGKIGTRDAVLNKVGTLTGEEFEEVRRHPVDGEAMLSPLRDEHPEVLQIVRSHHEQMDGRGFPDGLSGEAIALPVRIVSVVDAFDAMTTPRTYGTPKTFEGASEELLRCAGSQFDPAVVDAFVASRTAALVIFQELKQ